MQNNSVIHNAILNSDVTAFCDIVKFKSTRRKRISALILIALSTTSLSFPGTALASEILLGSYIKVGVNDKGTLGVGGNTSPGILYDGAGTGTFNSAYDYLTPGTPFEGFTVSGNSGSAFSATNNNSSLGSAAISGTLTAYNGAAYNGTTYDHSGISAPRRRWRWSRPGAGRR